MADEEKTLDIRSAGDTSAETVNFLVYGKSGVGKTYMLRTCDGPLLIADADRGMMSLSDVGADDEVDVVKIRSGDDMVDFFKYLKDADHGYEWAAIDSISALAEIFLDEEMKTDGDKQAHGLAAYGDMQRRIINVIKLFKKLPINVVILAKEQRENVDGSMLYCPFIPGKYLTQKRPIAHDFDQVYPLHAFEKEDEHGESITVRKLQTVANGKHVAKSRDPKGVLARAERPDLGAIRRKLMNQETTEEDK